MSERAESGPVSLLAVVVPTRNRPDKLARCLRSVDEARKATGKRILIVVADSSGPEFLDRSKSVAAAYEDLIYREHDGSNVAYARNACVDMTPPSIRWLVNVDDDIVLDVDCLVRFIERINSAPDRQAVIGGSVSWSGKYSMPVLMRWIGWGRYVGAPPWDFIIGALFAYPRRLASGIPWNTRIRTADDIFMGAMWRARGVPLEWEPQARATHDVEHNSYGWEHQDSHFYAIVFDALFVRRSLPRTLSCFTLGIVVMMRGALRSGGVMGLRPMVTSTLAGMRGIWRDRRYLKSLVDAPPWS